MVMWHPCNGHVTVTTVLALATLGSAKKIGMIVSVSRSARWPRQVCKHSAVFTFWKFIAIKLVTVTRDTHHCSCLGYLGRHNTDRIVSISCHAAQGGQGKNMLCRCSQRFYQNNIANPNDPLLHCNIMGINVLNFANVNTTLTSIYT